jgi:hypothetical protein
LDPSRCLAAGIDVGKYEALCLIADHRGELVGQPVTFALAEVGAVAFEPALTAARQQRAALSCASGSRPPGLPPRDRVLASRPVLTFIELNRRT